MRTDEPEMNGRNGTRPLPSAADASAMGPPAPNATDDRGTPPIQKTDSHSGPTEQAEQGQSAAESPIALHRSPDEPVRESTVATGFWDVSQLTGHSALPGILMAGGVLLMSVILLSRLWRGKRQRGSQPAPTPREQIDAIRDQARSRADIEAFKVEAHDFTRQLAALLDSKAARLERLIADADERLARLDRTGGGAARPQRPIDAAPCPAPSIASPATNPAHERIYRLADQGLDPIEIARKTGQPTGQVELILALRG